MSSDTSNAQALSTKDIKKTAIATSISLLLGGLASPTALGALPTNATLTFTLGTQTTVACNYGTTPPCAKASYAITDVVGSYFAMDQNSNGAEPGEKTAIGSNNGIVIGTTQASGGSHPGPIDGSESPNIDLPWTFFGGTGMHQTATPVTDTTGSGITRTLDFSGWEVTWNGINSPAIPVVDLGTTITCSTASCTDTDTYTIDGAFHVNGANFTTVPYFLHLEGSISLPGSVPVAINDTATTIAGNPRTIDVLTNDQSADALIPGSVTITSPATSGTAVDNADDTVTYTPTNPGFTGQDTFVYTVDNANGSSLVAPAGTVGEQGIVTVDVQPNAAPVAVDDPVATNPVALDNGNGSLTVNVLANDTDSNNSAGLPGGFDVTKVSVTNAPGNTGACTANADGTITYSQTLPSVAATDSCTYTVTDIDSSTAGPLTSNVATVSINVQSITSDWPTVLPPNTIPLLAFDPGVGSSDQSIKPENSYFSMQVSATQLIFTALEPGPDGGFLVGYNQPATGTHTGSPNGTEQPGFSAPWIFFSNTGFDLTKNGGITANANGTLEFRNKYNVSWNGIPEINLGGSSKFPSDLGFATITCSDKPCQHNSSFILDYAAHVEDLPGFTESGFDGVAYTLHLEGTVKFLDNAFNTSSGNITTETRLAASAVAPDAGVDLQCVGGCFDYTISGVAPSSKPSIVLPLAGGVPNFPVWRILDNGVWRDFDTSAGDTIKTATFTAGGPGMICPPPGDPAYIDLDNASTTNVGHQCVELSVTDNGLNDLDNTPGTISDPGGFGTAGAPEFVDNRTSDTSGCSIGNKTTLGKHGEWWLLAGFLGWLGWNRGKRAQKQDN